MTSADDLLDLDITGFAHGGTGVARYEGRVVFVSDAIPGERVRAQRHERGEGPSDTQRFWRADTVEVLDASPHRRPHIWPEADIALDPQDRPGGADLGHIALDHQRALLRQVLAEALDRFAGGGIEAPEVGAVDEGDGTGWRTRMSLHVDDEGRIGPFAARSHRVIPVSTYPLAAPAIAEVAGELRSGRSGRIDLVLPADGRVRTLRHEESRRRPRSEVVIERVGEREFRVDADGFWQVHPHAATTLDAVVRDMLADRVDPAATHFDLYGGVGLFSSSLSLLGARRIVTVESSPRATAHAKENLPGDGITAVTARVDRFLSTLDAPAHTGIVLLDPPRAGAGRAVVESIDALAPDAVVYVACDPVALARDLGTFRGLGWEVADVRAFDLFPHSHHFETVALLRRDRA